MWLLPFLLGIAWFVMYMFGGNDFDVVIANIWMATSFMLANNK